MMNIFFFLSGLVLSEMALAHSSIVYGEDNRLDTYASPSALFQKLAKSTAAMVSQDKIKIRGSTAELIGPELGDLFKLCPKERFYHQPFVAECSGFLVAPDIIVSAGHCFENRASCTRYRWVFNFKVDDENQRHVSVNTSDVYECKNVIARGFSENLDYAVIRLDRRVEGVSPVKISTEAVEVGTPVVMIGHPSGLPQKITDHAVVTSVTGTEFKATLDAFQINSGSAVFNANSGELLGILVRGGIDYRTNKKYQCSEVNSISDKEGGEDISLYSQFTPYLGF